TATLVKQSSGIVKPIAKVAPVEKLTVKTRTLRGDMPKALRPQTVFNVAKPQPILRAVAQTGKTVVITPTAIAGLKAAAKVAGRAILPLSIGLSAYELADRVQKKGVKTDVGDVAAAASGLGGLGLRKVLPESIKKAIDTPILEVPAALGYKLKSNEGAQQRLASKVASASKVTRNIRRQG